ncbi:MAG: TonB-dependent receptor, partial [Sphingobacteriales bacterium 24-40-4]
MKSADSSLVRTAVSDLDGKFLLSDLPAGDYFLTASMIGFKKISTKAFSINQANPSMNFPEIIVAKDSKMLGEVTVRAIKPFVERKMDRLVVNVENSSVAAGSTALEVLQRAPGVTVDQNDNIAMQGKQGVLVMIDGKQTYMSNADV